MTKNGIRTYPLDFTNFTKKKREKKKTTEINVSV